MAAVTNQEWIEYKEKYNKKYSGDDGEMMRRELFAEAKVKIQEHNKKYERGEFTYNMAINHLADSTFEEMIKRCGERAFTKKYKITRDCSSLNFILFTFRTQDVARLCFRIMFGNIFSDNIFV